MEFSRRARPFLIALAATAMAFLLRPVLQSFDGRVYDLGLTSRPVRTPDNIEILGIDDEFMQGRHAYLAPRDRLAKLIAAVADAHPRAIALDVWLDSRINERDDKALRDALLHARQQKVPVFLTDIELDNISTAGSNSLTGVAAHGSVLPYFREAVAGTGNVVFLPDIDKAVRSMPRTSGLAFLPFLVARAVSENGGSHLHTARFHTLEERLHEENIPIDYRGGPGAIRITPATQIVEQPMMATLLSNKTIFIGATSLRLYDILDSPYTFRKQAGERSLYGVEVLAHATATLLDDAPRRSADTTAARLQIAVVVFLLTLGAAVLAMRGALPALLYTLLAETAALFLGFYSARVAPAWLDAHYWPPSAFCIAIPLAAAIGVALRQYEQAQELKVVTDTFGAYVGSEVLDQLGGKMPELGGEIRPIAVLFCDIRGYTALAERMQNDPAKLMNELNAHFTPLVQALKDHGAYADNYVGDLVMALFGAPVSAGTQRHNVYNAVAAARAFVRLIDERNAERRATGLEPIEVGIGLHCGEAVVGNLGTLDKQRNRGKIHYTAIGDTVNIASRIESKTRQYDVALLVSEEVVQICSQAHPDESGPVDDKLYPLIPLTDWEFVDETTVKGRSAPVRLYKPAGKLDATKTQRE